MGLLACEGIGIFDLPHAVVESSNVTWRFPHNRDNRFRTHRAAWMVLRYWATLQRAKGLLNDVISPLGTSLETWFDWLGANGSQALAYHWLCQWGLDLKTAEDDQRLRNLASYRPSELRLSAPLPAEESVSFIEALWKLFEPTAPNRFPFLEQELLRAGLKKRGANLGNAKSILLNKNVSEVEADSWHEFLNRPDDHVVLREAEQQTPIDNSRCHLQVIARAALLLYLASASVRKKLTNAGITEPDLRFWWIRYGASRGLWSPNQAPASPQDLWADVAVAISDSESWRSNAQNTAQGLSHWRRNTTSAVDSFGAFELVAIWSLT